MEDCGTLSITYRGWLSPRNELAPRIVTELAAPGAAIDEVTFSPATLPCNRLLKEAVLEASLASGRKLAVAPVKSLFLAVP